MNSKVSPKFLLVAETYWSRVLIVGRVGGREILLTCVANSSKDLGEWTSKGNGMMAYWNPTTYHQSNSSSIVAVFVVHVHCPWSQCHGACDRLGVPAGRCIDVQVPWCKSRRRSLKTVPVQLLISSVLFSLLPFSCVCDAESYQLWCSARCWLFARPVEMCNKRR